MFGRRMRSCGGESLRFIRNNAMMLTTIMAVFAGFILGLALRFFTPTAEVLLWIGIPGQIFIRLLELTILPLIAANVIIVTSTLDLKENGKISFVAFSFIVTSNILAAVCGSVSGVLMKPGHLKLENMSTVTQGFDTKNPPKTSDIFSDLLFNLFPNNLVGISIYQSRTTYISFTSVVNGNETEFVKRTIENISSVNMLGLLFCCFVFGIAAGKAGEQGRAFLDFFRSLASIVFRIMNLFLLFTPLGVLFMIAGPVAAITDLGHTFSQLGLFVLTVLTGVFAHMSIMLIIYTLATRQNPFKLIPYWFRTWLIAFTTLAPVVAIPEMFKASDRLGVDPNLSRFVVPLTAALKGDGSAVFIAASAIFIAQLTETPVTIAMVVIICLLSASAVFAIPSIPSSSLVILVTILSSLGIPVNFVGILFAMEWILDRLRTSDLAIMHMYCLAFTHYLCRGGLKSKVVQIDFELENTAINSEYGISSKKRMLEPEIVGDEQMDRKVLDVGDSDMNV